MSDGSMFLTVFSIILQVFSLSIGIYYLIVGITGFVSTAYSVPVHPAV